jgi:hypothetical protein
MDEYFVGLDLGQSQDFTALAILERTELTGAWDPAIYAYQKMAALRLRYLERVPLGTTYPEVVARVREVTRSAELHGRCELVVDATGVGRPLVDLLRAAELDCRVAPVVVTAGDAVSHSNGYYHVPKRDLIVGLQVLLQRGGLEIAAGMAFRRTLIEEMTHMQVRQKASGHEQFGAWREGQHDDLVFAVALAHWWAKKRWPGLASGDDGVWKYEGELVGWEGRRGDSPLRR